MLPLDALSGELAGYVLSQLPGARRVVRGVSRGRTEVGISAAFDDDDPRRGCATITVVIPNDLVIAPFAGAARSRQTRQGR